MPSRLMPLTLYYAVNGVASSQFLPPGGRSESTRLSGGTRVYSHWRAIRREELQDRRDARRPDGRAPLGSAPARGHFHEHTIALDSLADGIDASPCPG